MAGSVRTLDIPVAIHNESQSRTTGVYLSFSDSESRLFRDQLLEAGRHAAAAFSPALLAKFC